MSKFTEQSDDSGAMCPYCNYENFVESEDYDEDEREEECGKCGKKYWGHESFEVTHNTRPDCKLNSEEHDFQPYKNSKYNYFYSFISTIELKEITVTPSIIHSISNEFHIIWV